MKRDGFNLDPGDLPLLARQGNIIPLCREVGADLLTPVAAFLRVSRHARHPFLLESIEGGEVLARYSFLGCDPVEIVRFRADGLRAGRGTDPLTPLRNAVAPYRSVRLPDLPRFAGGAVGYLSYDMARLVEQIPETTEDDLGVPDMLFGVYDTVLA